MQQCTSSHKNFLLLSLMSHSNAKCQPDWEQMEISVTQAGTAAFSVSQQKVWWAQVMLLTRSHSWCMCSCFFSGIRQASLRCNQLISWNYMCTMLFSNVRPSQVLRDLALVCWLNSPPSCTPAKTCCIFCGFVQLSSPIGGGVMGLQSDSVFSSSSESWR